jgi:hypothetical protein
VIVTMRPAGRLGNQIFQYMFVWAISQEFPGSVLANIGLEELGIASTRASISPAMKVLKLTTADVNECVDQISLSSPDAVVVEHYAQDMRIYEPYRDAFVSQFRCAGDPRNRVADSDLLIHLRLGDTLSGVHPDYWPQPLSWYEHLIQETGLHPVFLGETAMVPTIVHALRSRFPGCKVLDPGSASEDFRTFQSAKHVVLSVSTFSWLATWLGEAASEIHLPVCGLFSPLRRPKNCFLPTADARYQFHILPDINRRSDRDRMRYLLGAELSARRISGQVTLWADPHMHDVHGEGQRGLARRIVARFRRMIGARLHQRGRIS